MKRSNVQSIWHRTPGESAKAHHAFEIYCVLGPDRSLNAVAQKCNKSVSILGRWSARWGWVGRAAAYDEHVRIIEEQARQQERAHHAAEMERRRIQMQDEAWEMFQKLRQRVERMLKFPVEDVTSTDGKTTIKAARWDFNTLPRLIESLVRLAAIAVPEEPETRINIDWETLSDEQLQRIVAGEYPLQVITTTRSAERPMADEGPQRIM